jgi:copper(I)-binding protein
MPLFNRCRCCLLLLAASLVVVPAWADDYRVGDLRIERPWARSTAPGVPVGAGYLTIRDTGGRGDRLVGAASAVAGMVQIHQTTMADGAMTMREQAALDVPAGGVVVLEPGGYHLMLMQLTGPLVTGERVPLTLEFAHSGRVTIELEVAPPGAPGPGR